MDVDEIVRGLSEGQKRMVLASEPGGWGREDCATGVEIRGAQYRTARALELVGVGTYTHGSPISDLYFNNAHGLAVRARLLEQDHG